MSFNSAEGLQAGQSQLKYKDIVFGTVKSLDLTSDHSRVLARIETTSKAASLIPDQTIFWVAKPRLFAGNVSGLDTLVSGSYVAIDARRRGRTGAARVRRSRRSANPFS